MKFPIVSIETIYFLFYIYYRELLKLGSSKPWPDAIRMLTRGKTSRMDADAVMEYFKPLMDWLTEQNAGETAGWSKKHFLI